MQETCASTAATNRFSLSRRAAQLAATHILELKPQQKQDQRLFPPPLLPRNVLTKVSFMDLNPLEVARQMTLIDHAHLRSISPSELYRFVHHSSSACSSIAPQSSSPCGSHSSCAWSSKSKEAKSPHVLAFAHRFNTVRTVSIRLLARTHADPQWPAAGNVLGRHGNLDLLQPRPACGDYLPLH